MAYKDEYEVARLYSDGRFKQFVQARFEAGAKLKFHLAPPLIGRKDRSGRPKKMKFPGMTMWLFKLLARLRFLRGSRFDPFGYLTERKEERRALTDFENLLGDIVRNLDDDNYEVAVELARLPEQVRGFGHIKSRSLAQACARQENLLKKFHGEIVTLTAVVDRAA